MSHTVNIYKLTLLSALSLFLCACASRPEQTSQETHQLIDNALAKAIDNNKSLPPSATSSQEVADALLPPINLGISGVDAVDVEPRFDIKVNRTSARKFFMGLVAGTPYNMVLHPDIKGRITLDLKNVTIPEVMDTVREVFGYDHERFDTRYHVFPNIMRTRIFTINYLDIKRRGESQMRVSSGEVTNTQTNQNTTNSSSSDSSSNTSRQALSGSRLNTESESDFWGELAASLRAMVGTQDERSIVVSPHSGIIVVRALTSELRIVEDFINSIQEISQRQVILEAKILEVQLSDSFQAGINWAALHKTNNNSFLAGQTGGGSIFDGGTSIIDGSTGNLNPSALSQVNGTATSAFGGVFTLALNIGNDFAAFVELLETQGDVQVLSSPQISTINNQKAVIKVGTDEFFITDVDTSTNTSSGISNTESDIELTPFFSGVALDVIPQISAQGDVILHIHPTVSSVAEETKNITISGSSGTGPSTLSVPLAISTIRESDSIIRAKDGQVVVIGGLMQNKVMQKDAGVPFFGDLPLVGGLFRHKQDVSVKSELVILLRPVVVESGEQWTNSLQQARKRFKKF